MGSVVAAVATVHTPQITGGPDAAPEHVRNATSAGFQALGKSVLDARPDVIVAFTSEHVVNLSPRCAVPFLLGIGPFNAILHEPAFSLPSGRVPAHPEFARNLVVALDAAGVDVGHSAELVLDHGTVLPLHLMGLLGDVPVVAIVTNTLFRPLPSLARSWAFGRALGEFVQRTAWPGRVALLATGGVSHSVGEARMGAVDMDFDRRFVGAIQNGDDEALQALTEDELDAAGNGTHEVRNWLALRAAIPGWTSQVIVHEPYVEGWGTGVYQVRWCPPSAEEER